MLKPQYPLKPNPLINKIIYCEDTMFSIIRRKDSLMLNLIVINIVAVLPCCGIIIAELIWIIHLGLYLWFVNSGLYDFKVIGYCDFKVVALWLFSFKVIYSVFII